ncbi:MAG: hypothetical protein QM811_30700 [Pirellulales bacterium]
MRLPRFGFRFSLRTLVVCVLLVAVVVGMYGRRYQRFRERISAKETLATYGVTLRNTDQWYGKREAVVPYFDALDRFLFDVGNEESYTGCYIDPREWQTAVGRHGKPNIAELLNNYPEILDCFTTEITPASEIDQDIMRPLAHAFAALPRLRTYRGDRIDAAWIEALSADGAIARIEAAASDRRYGDRPQAVAESAAVIHGAIRRRSVRRSFDRGR